MNPERHGELMRLFERAVEQEPAERQKLLEALQQRDPELRRLLDGMLLADSEPTDARLRLLSQAHNDPLSGLSGDHISPSSEYEDYETAEVGAGDIVGQYELIREIGRGGLGVVFLARDLRLGRRVAVKFLRRERGSRWADRFMAEARITALCQHDNIVVIHDVGETPGHFYMVLEHLEGITLRTWLQQRWQKDPSLRNRRSPTPPSKDGPDTLESPRTATTVPPMEALELMIPVVRALAHAHALGMVHRDLKPENIMLTDDGHIKVLDFGIAKRLDTQTSSEPGQPTRDPSHTLSQFETSQDMLLGTLPYMSPEQWLISPVDERSDIWAAGLIFWEIVTGQHPLQPLAAQQLQSVSDLKTSLPALADAHPEIGPLGKVIDQCLKKNKEERIASGSALLQELEALRTGKHPQDFARVPADSFGGNPYAGLASFQESDAARFFGREGDVARVQAELRHRSLVTIVGPSGAGKSSFVRAGIIPAMKRTQCKTEAFFVRPGRDPLTSLVELLFRMQHPSDEDAPPFDSQTQEALSRLVRSHPGHFGAAVRAYCRRYHRRLVIFVDPFEELYTATDDRSVRDAFVSCLDSAADDPVSPIRVVLALRSDFLDRVAENRAFGARIMRGLVLLPPLGRIELHEALVRPLESTGFTFESGRLIQEMLEALNLAPTPLPLLQFTASRLWEVRDHKRRQLTYQSYTDLGGMAGALAAHADAVLDGFSPKDRHLARWLFTHLVSEERTRTLLNWDELRDAAPAGSRNALEHVVQALAAARLIFIETDPEHGAAVELSHESLIKSWPKLKRWLDEDQEGAQFRLQLRTTASDWHKRGRSNDLLWRGRLAFEAQRWLEHWRSKDQAQFTALEPRDRAYLEAVVRFAAQSRRRRRLAWIGALVAVSSVAVVVSVLALQARQAARRADEQAAEALRHAAEAVSESIQARNATRMSTAREHQSDPTLALALVRELNPAHPPKRWAELARWALQQGVAELVLTFDHAVLGASFSPEGHRIATAAQDNTVRVFDLARPDAPIVFTGHNDAVYSAVFSPDGTRILTASWDKTVRIYDIATGSELAAFAGHTDRVNTAAFSPDGTRIVTASADKKVRLYRADTPDEPLVLHGHTAVVHTARFNPSGTRVVTASDDGTARVFSADGKEPLLTLRGHTDAVLSAAFSPDGKRIITSSWDQTVRVFSSQSGKTLSVLKHPSFVTAANFSPDGRRIVTASGDKKARVYNADGSGDPWVYPGHQMQVNSAVFSPDGRYILTSSLDKTVRIYRVEGMHTPKRLRGHTGTVYAAAFSPDGTRVVTASADQTALVHDLRGERPPRVLRGHTETVYSAAFSPDGSRIVTASRDATARVYKVDGAEDDRVLRGHTATIYTAVFSPDGRYIVTASEDHTARVYCIEGAGDAVRLQGHTDAVYAAAFSPDGQRVVTASRDGTARVHRADGVGPSVVLSGHGDALTSAVFTPDGRRVITASWDETVHAYRADGVGEPRVFSGHTGAVVLGRPGGTFSPDGQRFITLSEDKTLRIWALDASEMSWHLRLSGLDPWSAAFSPNGRAIVTTSHSEAATAPTGSAHIEHTAWLWNNIEPLNDLNDPVLWRATSFCPGVKQRMELLGVSEKTAVAGQRRCRQRVKRAYRLLE